MESSAQRPAARASCAAFIGEPVVNPRAAVGGHLAGRHPFFAFHGVQDGVHTALADGDDLFGGLGDRADDFVPVHFAASEEAEDEQLGHAIHEREVARFLCHVRMYTSTLEVCQ